MRYLLVSLPAFCLLLASHFAAAQGNYPSKPIVVVVSTAAGGPNEFEARPYTIKAGQLLGQTMVLDFKPGAGTAIGNTYVAKAAPDGYTILVATASFTIFPNTRKNPPFDTIRDFAPIVQMSERSTLLLVHNSLPLKNIKEYIAYAKANPGKLNYGTTGVGDVTHLSGVWLHTATDTKVTYVAYKASAAKNIDLLEGRLQVSPIAQSSALPLLKKGGVHAIAVMNGRRSKVFPDLPTVAEQGLPGYDYPSWLGFVAPAKVPTAIINRLNEAFVKVTKDPDIIKTMDTAGVTLIGNTPAQFRQHIAQETARVKKAVEENNIEAESED